MRTSRRTLTALAIGGVLLLGGHLPALAQDATPLAVDPAECTVAPRTTSELVALWNASAYEPDAALADGASPTGTPASDEVLSAVNATLRQFIGCANANDFARQLALVTDNGVLFYGPGETATEALVDEFFAGLLASPVAEADYETVLPLQDVIVLADGRVGAVAMDGGDTVYLIFAEQDGVWLIDSITERPANATPTA